MNFQKLYYLSHNGGNCNFLYSLKAYTREYTLRRFTRRMLNSELKKLMNVRIATISSNALTITTSLK